MSALVKIPPEGSFRRSILESPAKLADEINSDVMAGADEIALAISEALAVERDNCAAAVQALLGKREGTDWDDALDAARAAIAMRHYANGSN